MLINIWLPEPEIKVSKTGNTYRVFVIENEDKFHTKNYLFCFDNSQVFISNNFNKVDITIKSEIVDFINQQTGEQKKVVKSTWTINKSLEKAAAAEEDLW